MPDRLPSLKALTEDGVGRSSRVVFIMCVVCLDGDKAAAGIR